MIDDIKNYVFDNTFKIIIFKNKLNIINYKEIDHFDDNKIIIRYSNKSLVIKGEELIITKLLDDEILINGKIKLVEFK
ncbi:MAG: YabP/YqfC family sporulation protein [Bacilli bacterium]|nr:YabP/YqfC family sporulation protein [Bacilli bacterium]